MTIQHQYNPKQVRTYPTTAAIQSALTAMVDSAVPARQDRTAQHYTGGMSTLPFIPTELLLKHRKLA